MFEFLKSRKGNAIMNTVLAVILLVAVAIPITTQVIDDANLTGTTATITNLLPMFLAIAGLVVVGALAGMGR